MIYYEDDSIKIRDLLNEDVINLFSCRIDRELNLHDPRPIPNTSKELLNECKDYCNRFDTEIMNENTEDRKYKYFIITNKDNNFIGFVNFFSINKEKKQGEMGVTIGDKRYFRKGIAYTAINAVVKFIFENMDINRIYIETGETNKAALGLFDKLGFKKRGEYLEDDNFKFIIIEKLRSLESYN
ncbi:GNAT family N-acetyltransferase [Clostridium sp. YIM B02515]|uniref:GNAT family N-acetyltransferase n=1 Tax=Clostridium rhizosphaerae TaxID=2803861 RepID=A0ABS1TGV9_9CLOT|nr:GNAT family N-acetyltransferase [Clostridium rhizosphaerae]MBL4938595.1 GNAT family N-acetyltransferase [Clostridium rhizosphaerae]